MNVVLKILAIIGVLVLYVITLAQALAFADRYPDIALRLGGIILSGAFMCGLRPYARIKRP